jgi:flagellar FliJ protein
VESAPFKFRLERLRELRADVEDAARQRFAGALAHLVEGETLVRCAADRVGHASAAQRGAAERPLSGSDLQTMQAWRERAERGRLDAGAELRERERLLEERRTEMLAAAREREVLERLKRRRGAEHAVAAQRAAAGALDDISQARHGRTSL